jgi:ornithine decarboxylase
MLHNHMRPRPAQVVGVSFHVGSGCQNLAAFTSAIQKARDVFDTAAELGIESMEMLDIGGGFTGHFDESGHVMFGDIARTINSALAAYFPPESGVKVGGRLAAALAGCCTG